MKGSAAGKEAVSAVLAVLLAISFLTACGGGGGGGNDTDTDTTPTTPPGISPASPADGITDEDVGIIVPDPAVNLDIAVKPICDASASHRIDVSWQTSAGQPTDAITVRTQLDSGRRSQVRSTDETGRLAVDANAAQGGILIVSATADTTGGETQASRAITLEPCVDPPPLPGPGERFSAPPAEPPQPPIAIPGSPITESDFVHLGGRRYSPNDPRMVSAVGTGAIVKLSSWTLDPDTSQLVHMADSANVVGHNVRLHVLTPETGAKNTVQPFITGVIRNGQLWLSSWQLNGDGSFLPVGSRGYGEDVQVRQFEIAHHSIRIGDSAYFLIVTPIITDQEKIRIITWIVNKATGDISGLQDNGDIHSNPIQDGLVRIARVPGAAKNGERIDYVVTYENENGELAQQLWEITDAGFALLRGAGASGLNLRGNDDVVLAGAQQLPLPLNGSGYMLAVLDGLSTTLSTWDFQKPLLDPVFIPHRVADDSIDQFGGPGLKVGEPPELTDGSSEKIAGGAVQKVRARLTDGLWEQDFGVGAGVLVDVMPAGEPTAVGIASVTKVMTLLLAVEAELNGEVDYADIVEVSEKAAGTGGSTMNLVAGEKQSLANLLYGMMMVSGNDASVAIAEHIAGSSAAFVERMNLRAAELGLADTSYNQPAAGGYSTPQDQITLFRFGSQYQDFLRFARKRFHIASGELPGGMPVYRNVDKFKDNGYPGLNGWKNGNLGFHDAQKKQQGVPLCTSCLLLQAQRAGRTMLVGIQQSGSRWGDAGRLLDYGFRRIWTPDRRGSRGTISNVDQYDIALDSIDDGFVVTAVITGSQDQLELCPWSVFVDLGQIDRILPCTRRDYNNLPGDPNVQTPPDLIAGVRLSDTFFEGDYATADLGNGNPRMILWRLGPKAP